MDPDDALSGLFDALDTDLRKLDSRDLFDAKGGLDIDDDVHVLEPAYELGREMILIRRPKELCLGIVGKTRVCVDGETTCTVNSHKREKFMSPFGDEPFLAIIGPKANGAVTFHKHPVLPVVGVDDDLINHLLSLESKEADLAGTINMIIKSGVTDLIEFKNGRNLLRTVRKRVDIAKTPAKISQKSRIEQLLAQLGNLQSSLGDAMASRITKDVTVKLLELTATDSDVLPLIVDLFNQQSDYIETLSKRLKNTISAIQLFGTMHESDLGLVNETLEGLTNNLDNIEGTLGKRSSDEAGLNQDPSLWGQANLSARRLDEADKRLLTLKDKIVILARALRRTRQFSDLGSVMTNESLSTVDEDNDTVMKDINFGPVPGHGPRIQNGYLAPPVIGGGNAGGGYATTAEDLRGIRVTGNVAGSGGNDGNNGNLGNGGNGGGKNHINFVQDEMESLSRRLHNLENGDAATRGEVLRFNSHVFHSPDDVAAFFDKQLGVGTKIYFSCFPSPNYIIDAVFRNKNPAVRDPKMMKVLRDLGLREQEMDGYFSADYKQTLPDILAHDKRLAQHQYSTKPSETINARFPALPSGEDMGSDGDNVGLHNALGTALSHVQNSCISDINRQLKDSDALMALATQMLTVSVSFVRSLFSFMSQTFQHLKATFDGEEQAWTCVCNSVYDLWIQHFFPMKNDMASVDFNDARNLASVVTWTSLRMVVQAKRFSTASLASHPTVSSSYIRFLIEHLSQKKTTSNSEIMNQLKALKNGLAESKKEINLLKGQIKSIESRADKLQGQLNSAKKQK